MPRAVLFSAEPAPSIGASLARHMVASRYLFDSRATLGAVPYVAIIRCPSIEVLVYYIGALSLPMPLDATLEANLVTALAPDLGCLPLLDEVIAIRAGTPPQIWVHINVNVLFEF